MADRFSEQSPAGLSRNRCFSSRCFRDEAGFPDGPAPVATEKPICPYCLGRDGEPMEVPGLDEDTGRATIEMHCTLCHSDQPEVDEEPQCATRYELVMQAHTVAQLMDQLKAHQVECAVCGSTKKTVETDAEYLGMTDPVYCEEQVA